MSFAGKTKAALCGIQIKKMCCRTALLLGILRAANQFSDTEIRFTTRSRQTAHMTVSLLVECFGDIESAGLGNGDQLLSVVGYLPAESEPQEKPTAEPEQEGGESYQIVLRGAQAAAIAECFPRTASGSWDALPHEGSLCVHCRIAYLRGVFLSCGNITDPNAYYHLDMVLPEDEMAETLGYFLEEQGLVPKHTARKGMPVLYFKDSISIEDFLNIIGAQAAMFALMDAKIYKEISNDMNRVNNCEIANLSKTVRAATEQYEAIRGLIARGHFELLPADLRQTAMLRFENPAMPLKDLAVLHNPPLTKSGLNHRLKKIVDFATESEAPPT
ncbi:MAG: DNA-binding protein WhiA [Clostridia bacterium]|nr:DNA-binding protein WhiA [Clostridia bacterium]